MFPCQWDKKVPVVTRILLPLRLQLKKAQIRLSRVVLRRWASLWRRCGEFCEMLLAYILTKSNSRMNWSRLTARTVIYSSIGLCNNLKMIRFYLNIIFSDEASFWLNGFVNKQNMRYWSDSNPHVLHESWLHTEKITVWCDRTSSVIIKTVTLLWMGIATVQW